jgi:predicted O-methyltransferase YrrM
MKRVVFWLALLTVLAALVVLGQRRARDEDLPLPKNEAEKNIVAVLEQMARQRETYLNVPVADGKMLRILAETAGAKNAVEIGTSTGYSSLWLCLALAGTGGHLTTFEIDQTRAAQAREHFRKAGVEEMVTVVEGDAHQTIARLTEPIDLLFVDADKEGYVDYLRRLLPLVRPGGLILAHNADMVRDYVRAVNGDPALETVVFRDGAGLVISVKKR